MSLEVGSDVSKATPECLSFVPLSVSHLSLPSCQDIKLSGNALVPFLSTSCHNDYGLIM